MYNILLILSLLSGFIAGICWMLGDIYIVGYSVDNGEDLEYAKIRDNPNEIMYLGIAEQQLRKGALLAQWSVPFFFFSLPYFYIVLKGSLWAILISICLFISYAWSPLAHGLFYYSGRLSQLRYELYQKGIPMDDPFLEKLEEGHQKLLKSAWIPAVTLAGIGWLLYGIAVLFGQSYFPRIFCLVNPIVFSFIATLLSKSRRGIWAKIHGAAFNIGNILFYILSLGYILIMWK